MPLELYFHPLSSFSQKVVTALYENDTAFTPHIVDFSDAAASTAFRKLWPIGKIPVLREDKTVIPESSIIIEYLALHHPGPAALVPGDRELRRQMRFRDRFLDLYINVPMQKIITDRLRPEGKGDAYGVADARAQLDVALNILDQEMADRTWAMGETFTMADCAAAPGLLYANMVAPFGDTYKSTAAYLARLKERPSFARALKEAEPYLALVPK